MKYLFALLVLVGCASRPAPQYRWQHSSGVRNEEMFHRDFGDCEARTLSTSPYMPVDRGVQIFGACMRSKGWSLVDRY